MADWSPTQYRKFEDLRTRPALDLLSAIRTANPIHAIDLGCGPGNSTEILVDRYPEARVVGLDTSPNMIDAAKQRLPQCSFILSDVGTWEAEEPQQVIFANAVLQWLPNHDTLLPRLASFLSPGGSLAIQMPDNLGEATHVGMRRIADDPRWKDKMAGADDERTTILSAADYHSLLKPHCSRVDIWRTTYYHPLAGLDGIVEWFKSTGLKPYLNRLTPEEADAYLTAYKELLAEHYKVEDGIVLLPFPRLLIVAER